MRPHRRQTSRSDKDVVRRRVRTFCSISGIGLGMAASIEHHMPHGKPNMRRTTKTKKRATDHVMASTYDGGEKLREIMALVLKER